MKEKIIKWFTDNNIMGKLLCYLTSLGKTIAARWRALNAKNKRLTVLAIIVEFVCLINIAIDNSVLLTIGYIAGLIIMTTYLIDTFVKQLPSVIMTKLFNYALPIMCGCFIIYFALHLFYIIALCFTVFVLYILIKDTKF